MFYYNKDAIIKKTSEAQKFLKSKSFSLHVHWKIKYLLKLSSQNKF